LIIVLRPQPGATLGKELELRFDASEFSRKPFLMTAVMVITCAMPFCASTGLGQILPNSPAPQWVTVLFGNNNFPDPSSDQQTGSAEADIVGNRGHPSLYMRYHDGGVGSPTNGYLGFRLRVGADLTPPGFLGAALVGMDANLDGRLDLFIGVNNQGSGNHVGLWNPGNGLNISPSTTSIVSPATVSYAETGSTYGFADVDSTIDPPALSFDLNGDSRTDQFLSFVVPFADVVAALAARGIAGFTKDTPMRLVAATATQDNSLNQDLIGVAGGVNSTTPWEQLGALTEPYSASSQGPVPEPSIMALFFVAVVGFLIRACRC
jgi:hypothetical protein